MSGEDDLIIGAVVTDQAAAEAAAAVRVSRRRKTAFPSPTDDGTCSNCGTVLKGEVCHSCGQSADELHRPVWQLVAEVADGLLGVEGRLWRTVPAIIFRPGHVTRQYLSGVRMRYVQPFRLYLAASVLFFLVAFVDQQIDLEQAAVGGAMTEEQMEQAREGIDQARQELEASGLPPDVVEAITEGIGVGQEQLEEATREAADAAALGDAVSAEQARQDLSEGIRCGLVPEDCPEDAEGLDLADPVEVGDGVSVDMEGLEDAPVEVRRYFADRADTLLNDPNALLEEMQSRAPQVMFFLLPIFALLLAMMHFWKRGMYFYDHLIVSLHFHAFIFFFLTLLIGVAQLIGAGWSILAFFLWSNFYLYRIHRRVYRHGRFSSLLRTIVVDFLYMIVLSVAMFIWIIAAILMA